MEKPSYDSMSQGSYTPRGIDYERGACLELGWSGGADGSDLAGKRARVRDNGVRSSGGGGG